MLQTEKEEEASDTLQFAIYWAIFINNLELFFIKLNYLYKIQQSNLWFMNKAISNKKGLEIIRKNIQYCCCS